MKDNIKTMLAAGILTAIGSVMASNVSAHLEPKKNDDVEKCYGVVRAGKNDCTSKANKHSCATFSKTDSDLNEWITLPKGACDKLVGGVIKQG